jgi:Putative redox-active protein (C_GCAxxG_C_C)
MKTTANPVDKRTQPGSIPTDPHWPEQMASCAVRYVRAYDSCAQSILWAFMQSLEVQDRMVLRTAGAMQGGMMSSLTCGVHTAGLMVLGLLVGRERLESGLDGMVPIIMPAQRMVRTLTERIGGHSCLAMTGVDFTDLKAAMAYKSSDDHHRCVVRVGDGARAIAQLLQDWDRQGDLFQA